MLHQQYRNINAANSKTFTDGIVALDYTKREDTMIALKDAVPSNYKAIAMLHADSWKENYRGMFSDKFLDNDVDANRLQLWQERLSAPPSNQHVIVAWNDEYIAGFACIYVNNNPVFGTLLDNLHVSSTFQKAGIGAMLMREAARRSYESDQHSKFYLWVFELNTKARHFYERLGATNYEAVEHTNIDGSVASACRYTWDDCLQLMQQ